MTTYYGTPMREVLLEFKVQLVAYIPAQYEGPLGLEKKLESELEDAAIYRAAYYTDWEDDGDAMLAVREADVLLTDIAETPADGWLSDDGLMSLVGGRASEL